MINKNDNNSVINLSKGGKINLTKELPSLVKIRVGLGWDPNEERDSKGRLIPFDLDASAFMVGRNGIAKPEGFIFYNHLCGPLNSVVHQGDNLDGSGSDDEDEDDEQIVVDLDLVPETIEKIAFTVTIHQAAELHLNFGMVHNSYCRLVDLNTNREVARFDLGEDYSVETSLIVCEIYRHNGEWKFNAIGKGYPGGLEALCAKYGINAAYQ